MLLFKLAWLRARLQGHSAAGAHMLHAREHKLNAVMSLMGNLSTALAQVPAVLSLCQVLHDCMDNPYMLQ